MPQGLIRVLNSSKCWTAVAALVVAIFAVLNLDPTKAVTIVSSVSGLAIAVIAATGYEDGKVKSVGNTITAVGKIAETPPATPAKSGTSAIGFKVIPLLLLIPAMLLAGGCQYLTPPAQSYADADNATYDAVAPEYQHYVANDPSLTATETARRERTLATWALRLKGAGETPTTLPSTTQAN